MPLWVSVEILGTSGFVAETGGTTRVSAGGVLLLSFIRCDKSVGADSAGAVFIQLGSVVEGVAGEALSMGGGCAGAPQGLSRLEVFVAGVFASGVGIEDGGVKVGIGAGSDTGGAGVHIGTEPGAAATGSGAGFATGETGGAGQGEVGAGAGIGSGTEGAEFELF